MAVEMDEMMAEMKVEMMAVKWAAGTACFEVLLMVA
jgi:hypothetical protein